MFVLLRALSRLRRDIGLRTPERRGSLAIRHVDSGSCNGCEHELGAGFGPHYDLARYGLNVVASPRHADMLLVTGAPTTRMVGPLRTAYDAMPEPRLVGAMGDCALGRCVLGDPFEFAGTLEEIVPVDVRIPGCPPSPEMIGRHLIAALELTRRGG